MKASLNWIKSYINTDLSPEKIGDILTDIGLEVEGMDRQEKIKGGLEGIVAGKIKTCIPHPNADKLSLCTVSIGGDSDLQIVCGAPNVEAEQTVWLATIGTTLYTSEGEAWKIKKGKIRGEVSEGMICAEDELGLGTSHDGIMVLANDIPAGFLAKDHYDLGEDFVYEIGLTPNRSDATSHTGVAFDLAAYLEINEGGKHGISMPDVSTFKEGNKAYQVEVKDFEDCPRYSGILLKDIQIKASPTWMQDRLRSIGISPKNNVVDITNFILHELGQPLHAFDADKIAGNKIIVQQLAKDSKFLDLEGKERTLNGTEVMICDANNKAMCIGGVFGGIDSGVSDETKNVFLESAHFNAKSIRRTSTKHLLRTDAAVCFEKGSDPQGTIYALKRASLLMQEFAGAKIASKIIDVYPNPVKRKEVALSYFNINRLIGTEISPSAIKKILKALNMDLVQESDAGFTVAIPTNKSDVLREADVIEEILRIYGYNQVPVPEKLKSNLNIRTLPDNHALKNRVANALTAIGFNEMMALSLTKSNYYPEAAKEHLVQINNTSNIHLDVMRGDMIYSALEAVQYNVNRQQSDLRLYEFGRGYAKAEEGFNERELLSVVVSGQKSKESWLSSKEEVDFYALKSYVKKILNTLGISQYQVSELEDDRFDYGLLFHRGNSPIVQLGKLAPELNQQFGISQSIFLAQFEWKVLLRSSGKQKIYFEEITKYPVVRRDLAAVVDNGVKFEALVKLAFKADKKILKKVNLFDVYRNSEQLGADKKSYAMSFIFENKERTLKDKEVDKIMKTIMELYEKNLSANIRR